MRKGKHTWTFENKPVIIGSYGIAGPKEGKGPLKEYYDEVLRSDLFGEKTYEKAECKMQFTAIEKAIKKSGKQKEEIDAMFAGDLLNQIVSSAFSARELEIPYLGLYNACSTFAEGLLIASALIANGTLNDATCSTSSHYSTAERQYRYPLELGTQMTPTAQWTVTGAGCVVLSSKGEGVKIEGFTIGRVVDYDVTDTNNMGAAMAPAAAYTLEDHLKETGRTPDYYDMILTGDLGKFGVEMMNKLLLGDGIDVRNIHNDCGMMVFDEKQNVRMGGSGAGCSSLVFSTYVMSKLLDGSIKRLLFMPTGALMSKDSSLQGESIPAIAHAISIEGL
ncbi:MAG: stage V sporulation protein AD [Clostridia bacterium]|nr:stage V sporulation protein AD [Clostridia bacterium]